MALMPVPAVPRAMPLLWVSLRLADAMRQSVPVNLTGDSGCDWIKFHNELYAVAFRWNLCLSVSAMIFWVSLFALCCRCPRAVRYVFAGASALVALWALVAPGLAGLAMAKVYDTHCAYFRTKGNMDGPIACYISIQGLESFLTCLVHIALCIQNLRLASPAKPETAPPTAPPAPLPAASQAAEAAAEVGEGKAES
ncbi:unnamed protein product [Cladocopium goreaui]|uniref:Uncharacterized protein n=1 Tax=Cladocopium goreaui TaxID=2562237 RepID=A0A9P1BVB7_9DINO|nr:unnamed protein product [Cladocopium goreaui]